MQTFGQIKYPYFNWHRYPRQEKHLQLTYLQHHPVTNVSNVNKPGEVMPVFDCAAKLRNVSFNNQCLQGPDLNNKLIDVPFKYGQ